LLSAVYPDYDWLPWKFEISPRNLWQSQKIVRKFLDWAGIQLGLKCLDEWHLVTIKVTTMVVTTNYLKDIKSLGGTALLAHHNFSLSHVLAIGYPEYDSKIKTTTYLYKKSQSLLKSMLNAMFAQEGSSFTGCSPSPTFLEALEEYRHPDILTSSGYPLELDLFYPKLKIAVEYQVTLANQ
jgi:hypothetical protein